MTRRMTVWIVFTIAVMVGNAGASEAVRTWTSMTGSTVDAAYVEMESGNVKLKGSDGTFFSIRENSLSAEDREWIQKEEERRRIPAGVRLPSAPDLLPVLDGGNGNGHFALVNKPNYDAHMNERGEILIRPKVNGDRVGRPIMLVIDCFYRDGGKQVRPSTVIAYREYPNPAVQPASITLSGLLHRDVPFHVTYLFTDQGIQVQGDCEDPSDIDHPTVYRMRVKVPRAFDAQDFNSLEALKQKVAGWQLRVDSLRGKDMTYTFWESIPSIFGNHREIQLDAPLFGIRRVGFKTLEPKIAYVSPTIYTGRALWEGFTVVCTKDEEKIRPGNLQFDISIQ